MSTPSEEKNCQAMIPKPATKSESKFGKRQVLSLAVFSSLALLHWLYKGSSGEHTLSVEHGKRLESLLECSLAAYDTSALDEPLVEPLPVEEYIERRDRLAIALVEEGLDAFVGEPGFTGKCGPPLFIASSTNWTNIVPCTRGLLHQSFLISMGILGT